MELSKRLKAVAAMVRCGETVADIGTDHAYVPIYLVEHKICSRGIAADVRPGPLSRAREHIEGCNLSGYIETRLSDGLLAFEAGEAQSLVIAGMGGRLTGRILQDGLLLLPSFREIILQPQSDLYFLRKQAEALGLMILEEEMLKEDGKYYTLIRAVPGQMSFEKEIFYHYGKALLEGRHPVLRAWLHERELILQELAKKLSDPSGATERTAKRLLELCQEQERVREALRYYESEP